MNSSFLVLLLLAGLFMLASSFYTRFPGHAARAWSLHMKKPNKRTMSNKKKDDNTEAAVKIKGSETGVMNMTRNAILDLQLNDVVKSRYAGRVDLLLGSNSSSRRQILENLGFAFEVVPAHIDEQAIGERGLNTSAAELVTKIAKAKADAILRGLSPERVRDDTVLLTADQVVVHNEEIREKPRDLEEARKFLLSYNCSTCTTVGSILLTHVKSGATVSGTHSSSISFRQIFEPAMESMLAEGKVLNCAGGLMIEHPVLRPSIQHIEGNPEALMGLCPFLLDFLLQDLLNDFPAVKPSRITKKLSD